MIGIKCNIRDFEYDVHSLTKAFYPKEEVQVFVEKDPLPENFALNIRIFYQKDSVRIQLVSSSGKCFADKEERYRDGEQTERKIRKNVVKQLLYQCLSQQTGQTLPWGTLTGIRPTKIPMALLEKGWKNTEIADYMRKTYDTSNEKTALGIAIANREKELLKDIDFQNGYSLYIGIPFCPSICLYCSFSSSPIKVWESKVDDYLTALFHEMEQMKASFDGQTLDTVYIGGGTPTTLNAKQLEQLLHKIKQVYDFRQVQEFTVEAGRPDSITREKLEVLYRYGVTRISINPQTMNQKTLDLIGRKHTVEQTREAFVLAREVGFDNINMDLIVGLPGEEKAEVAETLSEIEKMRPDSLTVHSLAIKRAARLSMFKEEYQEMSFTNNQEIMNLAQNAAARMEMGPYYLYRQKNMAGNLENIGYAKEGKAGIYNILIMEEKQSILAVGAGSTTKIVMASDFIRRIENVKDVKNYLERIDEMIQKKQNGIIQIRKEYHEQ